MATPIRTTILNVLLNPYDGKRPKKPEKVYDMDQVFDALRARAFPIVLKPTSNKQVKSITIQSVYACLPGGRGCVGKERMGTKLQDRQIAMVYDKGYLKNPSHKNKSIGFLQMLGTIEYKDGTVSNLSVPVESSGVVGVRAGGMTIDPSRSKNQIDDAIAEIESTLFKVLKFKKVRASKIVMINGTFNLFSNVARKENRPRVAQFAAFLNAIHKNGLNKQYKKPTMPWQNRQGAPSVVKSVFKSDTLPTLMITPLGHCEVMGASSFDDIVQTYTLVSETYNKIRNTVAFTEPEKNASTTKAKTTYKLNAQGRLVSSGQTRAYRKQPRVNVSILNNNIQMTNKKLLFKKKPCVSYKKHVVQSVAERQGLPTRGTKADLCERIAALF